MSLGKWLSAIMACYLWGLILLVTAATTYLGTDYRAIMVWAIFTPMAVLFILFMFRVARDRWL